MKKARKMTEGTPWKLILLFALPLMAGHALQQLYNTVDGIVVGNFVSSEALGAVGTCASLVMLFLCFAVGMSTGSAVVISQFYGANRYEDMRRAVSTCMIMMVGLGIVLTVIGEFTADLLLKYVLNVPEVYRQDASVYFRIFLIGLAFQFLYNICAAVLRSFGDSKATLYFLIISSISNIALDLLFVIAFHWDVAGVAIATVIAHILSAIVAVIYMFKKYEVLRFKKGEFRFHKESAKISLKMAIPTTLQQSIMSFGSLALQRLVNTFDLSVPGLLPGYVAGQRLETFLMIPAFCINATMATYTGQNVGAGRFDRIRSGRTAARIICISIQVVVGLIAFFLRHPLIRLFGVGGVSESYGLEYLVTMIPCVLIFALNMSTIGTLQGSGDVMFTTFASISGFILRVVLAYVLGLFTPLGYRMIWLNLPMGWIYSTIICAIRFYGGKWKTKAIVHHEPQEAVEDN
ncbi:MAG: MATE family efflux transporter [Lachnospiraceae bacterium]|jgi:putative MATE family efflux protein|nr:MATE family efflux transporter [Lachnospiraceae bacterium]